MNDTVLGASNSPQISVLVPVYNVERYLDQCLRSLCSQSFGDFEVICINDGSSDGSRGIIERYLTDSRFKVIDKPNSGYGASMNRGLDEACGKYVAILESDDFLDPDAFSVLHSIAEANDAEVAKSDFFLFWSEPQEGNEPFGFVSPSMEGHVIDPIDDPRIFYRKPSIWSALYRRDFLEANQIRFLETPGASYQDASFNFKVWASAKRVILTRQAFLHYRQDNESSSVNSPGKVYCVCDEYQEMFRFLKERTDLPETLRAILTKMKFDSYIWNYERLVPELQTEFIARMSEEFTKQRNNGELDLSLLEPWKVKDLKKITTNPISYHRDRARFSCFGSAGKALHYLISNGPVAMVRMSELKKQEAR